MDSPEFISLLLEAEPDELDSAIKDVTADGFIEPVPDSFDAWERTYRPIQNTIVIRDEFNGTMFETYGPELDFVRAQNPNKIWTYVNGDNDSDIILPGFHYVNRQGYFITEQPWTNETQEVNFTTELIDNDEIIDSEADLLDEND